MANWKEIGFVPDSDDEDELELNTLEKSFCQDQKRGSDTIESSERSPLKTGEAENRASQEKVHNTSISGFESAVIRDRSLDDVIDIGAGDDHQALGDGYASIQSGLTEQNEFPPVTSPKWPYHFHSTQNDRRSLALVSSPSAPREFKAPKPFWEEVDHDDQGESGTCMEDKLIKDDISKSYVQISSPASSVLSSPPSSLIDVFECQGSKSNTVGSHSDNTVGTKQNNTIGGIAEPTAPLESTYPMKRALRQRNLIQLHPYIVEQEKYRQALKARGIAPMRIILSQNDRPNRSHRVTAAKADAVNEEDSPEIDVGQFCSQSTDRDWDPILSSCPTRTLEVSNSFDHNDDSQIVASPLDDNESLPDINTLVKQKKYLSSLPNSVTPQRNTAMKISPNRGLSDQYQLTENSQNITAGASADPPVSPESPPILQFTGDNRLSSARISSLSSLDNDAVLQANGNFKESNTINLITPAHSAMRQSVDAITINSDIDPNYDDPFVSSPSVNVPVLSSSDESVQLRKVYKKMRGVLPASHLRLDIQKALKNSSRIPQELYLSPPRIPLRKGVAIPKARKSDVSESNFSSDGLKFLADNSADENDEDDGLKEDLGFRKDSVLMKSNLSIFDQSTFVEEVDSIDAMLPSRARRSPNTNSLFNKRKKLKTRRIQPRITDHLKRPREQDKQLERSTKRPRHDSSSHQLKAVSRSKWPKVPVYSRLSILDVTDLNENEELSKLPNFMKIAIRTAKSRKDYGRQTPYKKYIRLATIEDTSEVQSIFENWKRGLIIPKELPMGPLRDISNSRPVLNQIDYLKSLDNEFLSVKKRRNHFPSKRNFQPSLEHFLSRNFPLRLSDNSRLSSLSNSGKKTSLHNHSFRPAQLESASPFYSHQNPSTTFKLSKKKLDSLYSSLVTSHSARPSFQLDRFLKDQEVSYSSAKATRRIDDLDTTTESLRPLMPNPARREKKPPRRIDASAARYRQPSNPLVLEILTPKENIVNQDNKLLGLGKFGTKYPVHFDILPLQQGTFFHDSTFIGSGRLKITLQGVSLSHQQSSPGVISFTVGDRSFSWSTWNEISSSELGICFDFLSEWFINLESWSSISVEPKHVILFVLDFVQQKISFDGQLSQSDFLSRIIEIIQEFSTRISFNLQSSTSPVSQKIEVLSICCALVLHLLQLARANAETSSFILPLETLLLKITTLCAETLLGCGLGSIRKLYDDLQYHTFRQAGIDCKNFIIQGWLTLIKVLKVAKLPRGSFWDITNTQLRLHEFCFTSDAARMEKLWYSLYTFLPLCEFDDKGLLALGGRHSARFDNWSIPQQLLKRVFTLYKLNQRQSPGFGEYCRTLLSRCHYLMMEWGWWDSSALIGSIFDFFASQNLCHLRNEEVYHSPRFLQELNLVPSLGIEPEDRCFHIFLKIVALRFRHLSELKDFKSIRNLGARLLPNHDRQYPKEEKIHQRDLASLRNHHDLLCILFWSMPPDQRPSTSLIQELVIFDRSHKEACLINLRSWENLARFIVTSTADPTSFQPFNYWQTAFFNSVYKQYTGAEAEVRQQSEEIHRDSGHKMTENQISEIVLTNKRNIVISMCRSIKAMGTIIKIATTDAMVKQVFNCAVLSKALDPNIYNTGSVSDSLLKEVIQVLVNYMDQIDKFHPSASAEPAHYNYRNEESQDSLDLANWGRIEMISLLESSLNCLLIVVQNRIIASSNEILESSIAVQLIDCWSRLICIVTENESKKFQYYLRADAVGNLKNQQARNLNHNYWPLFLAKLLHYGKSIDDFKLSGIDIGLEWLLSLTKLETNLMLEAELTAQMYQKRHYFCTSLNMNRFDRIQIIRTVICKMNSMLLDDSVETQIGLTKKLAQRHFSEVLGEVQVSMQQVLESLEPSSHSHIAYLAFARSVITNIKCYASGFRNLSEFFIRPSAHYWPHDADPNLYVAGIISYCVRLNQQSEKTSLELFYYLYSGWTNSLVSGRLEEFKNYIKVGMKQQEFTHFMLTEFVPAILEVGFNLNAWPLCSTFLPAIAHRISRLLETTGPESEWAFQQFVNILKFTVNGINKLAKQFQHGSWGADEKHRGILAVTLQFWMQNAAAMRQFMERYSELACKGEKIINPLSSFIYNCLQKFEGGTISAPSPTDEFDVQKGKFTAKFASYLTQEICECWQFIDEARFGIFVRARSKETSAEQRFEFTLGEVLRGEIGMYEVLFENKYNTKLPGTKDLLLRRLAL